MLRAVFGGGLLGLPPDEHRIQRKLLNPVFNMKFLREYHVVMPIFMGIAKEVWRYHKRSSKEFELIHPLHHCSKEVDLFPWATAAALDLVGEAGLGYSFNSFSGERNEYSTAIKGATQAEEVIRSREAALSAGNDLSTEAGRGRDIMTLLMKANESTRSDSYIDRETMIGHMNVFIFAGHETTSTALSRILDVLAHRPDVQVRLREELRQYFEANSNEGNHDELLELPYIYGIMREVLRLHPPVAAISRVCTEDTVLPLDFPVDTPSGKVTSISIKKGI
ncbi:hypothetical protein RSOLAG22IIIB_10965 [Rhizoctonia solani]|uniref:Uncharacterized protein n=1 Tax=Rhizoctonia solani TaxID=456999 RepID=A0A0K6G6H7_9AGAM|nr:hypothetical protein RSOLAG22IIIB_10965 [Rhizoctonia solani]